jgi:hypothetical protein
MVVPWIGDRRVAFVPVSNRQVDTTVPNDFRDQVYRRAFLDPDPNGQEDNSLKGYIHQVSSGRASLTGFVFPPVVADDADVISAGLESLPHLSLGFFDIAIHGFEFGVMVLPHSAGIHRGGFAWYPGNTVNGVSYYARVALFTNPTLSVQQNIGVWAMETLHMICRFGDLYFSNPPMGRFDVMSCACGPHPSAYTKNQFGWVGDSAIASHPIGTSKEYALSAVSYAQPPAPGRTTAVRINSQADSTYYMIEARNRTDRFEGTTNVSSGIPAEGVIVYHVRNTVDLVLEGTGLTAGNQYRDTDEDFAVQVQEDNPGGYRIRVGSRPTLTCRRLRASEKALEQSLSVEQDINRRKQIISALAKVREQIRQFGCLPVLDPGDPVVAWDESVQGRLIGSRLDEAVAAKADYDTKPTDD